MNYTLIMLDNPILVSDEEIEAKTHYLTKDLTFAKGSVSVPKNLGRKIIAGIEGLPKLDLSLIAKGIGSVDVEKLAEEKYPIQKGGSAWMPTTHDCIQANKQEGFIEGFKAAQSLNEKKYSLLEMEQCWLQAQESALGTDDFPMGGNTFKYPSFEEYTQSPSKPKEYSVEYIQEGNTIKVTKIIK